MINCNRKSFNNLTLPSIDNPHLINYPEDARENILNGIDKKMVDFMFDETKGYDASIAMEYLGVKITYLQLKQKVIEYAKALRKFGIEKGDFISICLPNMPEEVYLKYAASVVGAVSNMIDPRTNPEGIKDRTNFSNSKLLFVVDDIYETKIKAVENKLNVEKIIHISAVNSLPKNIIEQNLETLPINLLYLIKNSFQYNFIDTDKFISITNFLTLANRHYGNFECEYEENLPVTALYTSGTTADAMKAGLFTNENYNAMVKNMHYGCDYIEPNQKFLGVIPFFSAYGSFCGFHHSFSNAWDVVLIPKFKPECFAKLLIKNKANGALGVPVFWSQLTKLQKNGNIFSNVQMPVTGGDRITSKSINEINNALKNGGSSSFLKIGYGATEFGGVVSATSDDEIKYNPSSVGIVLPSNDVIIINPETEEELGYNQVGELCVSGPTMMLGYLNDDAATKKITIYKNGKKYYRTGDKMEINEFGDLIFHDRYKRVMMRPDGHTVACTPIEETISSLNYVDECAVVGIKLNSDLSGVIPTAFIKLNNNVGRNNTTAEEIDKFCLTKLGERERALAIVFVDKIPYTINGKVDFMNLSRNTFDELNAFILENTFFEKKQKVLKKV